MNAKIHDEQSFKPVIETGLDPALPGPGLICLILILALVPIKLYLQQQAARPRALVCPADCLKHHIEEFVLTEECPGAPKNLVPEVNASLASSQSCMVQIDLSELKAF